MQKDSAFRTIQVAVLLYRFALYLLTAAAVVLRDKQEKNKQLDIKKKSFARKWFGQECKSFKNKSSLRVS